MFSKIANDFHKKKAFFDTSPSPVCCSPQSSDVMTGNRTDVIRSARQILNRSTAHHTIPKQECMVELAELPLVLCSEDFETVNLSGSYKLTSSTHRDLLSRYRKEAPQDHSLSLHDFVTATLRKRRKNDSIIPHYVGASGQPKYPPTKEYAMATLLVYKPWASSTPPCLSDTQWLDEFRTFVASPECPKSVALEYARVKERYESKRPEEAVATEECYDRDINVDMDETTKDILGIITRHTASTDPYFTMQDYRFERGLSYDWSKRFLVSNLTTNTLAVLVILKW